MSPRPRLRVLAFLLPLAAVAAMLVAAVLAPPASAHGSVTDPPTRNYGCWERWGSDHLNPEMATLDPMCWQAFQADPNVMWNWNGLFREGIAGQHEQLIPDGTLCSGGRTGSPRYDVLDTPGAWKTKDVPRQFTLTLTDGAKHGADYLRIYVSKAGFDPTTQALGWDDLDLLQVTGRYGTTGLYQADVTLPADRSGRAVLYTVWQASHLDQSYYLCSDINVVNGQPTPTPTTTPTATPTPTPTVTPTTTPTATPTPTPTPTATGGTGCTAVARVTTTWTGGYQGELVVTAGASALTGWRATVSGGTLTQAWNGTLTGSTIANASWNGSVPAGGSTTAGFLGSGSSPTLTATCATP